MADNKTVRDGDNVAFIGAADELGDGSFSPKITLLAGDSSATPYRIDQALGALTETAPASDTASSGLNGRLQRIAQRITSLIALLPTALTGSGNLKTALLEAVPAGENHVGEVGGNLLTIAVTPTVEATPDYSTGDVIGGKMTLANAARVSAGTGYITGVRITSQADITVPIDVIFFRADPTNTTWTENAAVAVNAADLAAMVGAVQVFNWFDLGTPVVGVAECRIPFDIASSTSLYAVMIARGTINLASTSDLIVEVTVDRN